jgi:hypothetical protein
MQDGNDVDKIFLVITRAIGRHLELSPVRELDLDLFCFLILVKISWGNNRMGGLTGGMPFLHLAFLRPSGGG